MKMTFIKPIKILRRIDYLVYASSLIYVTSPRLEMEYIRIDKNKAFIKQYKAMWSNQ